MCVRRGGLAFAVCSRWLPHACMQGGGRVSARRPRYLSLLRQRKVPQRKATPLPVSPPARWASGAACDARSWGVPQNSLRSSNSAQTAAASQTTMRLSFGTRSPQALRFSARSEGGGSGLHSGHCFARPGVPSLRSVWAEPSRPNCRQRALRASPTPGAAAQQQPCLSPLPTPAGCAEKRRAWGGCVCRRTHALRGLARRGCLSGVRRTQRVPRRHPRHEHRRLPPSPDRAMGDADWGSPSLW